MPTARIQVPRRPMGFLLKGKGSFCRKMQPLLAPPPLVPPCPPPSLPPFFSPTPPLLTLDKKTTQRQVFKTTTLPTCLPPQTQRPKDGYFEKYFLRKCGDFPGTDLTCINILYHLIRLLDNKTTYKKLLHTIRIHKNIHHMYTRNSFARSLSNCLPVLTQNPG